MESVYRTTPPATRRSDTLKAALAYAKRGVPVFPCKPAPDKSPRTPHGFKDATTDPRRITAWWNRHPEASIGIPTGEASGLLVLDEDRSGALDELPGELPATRTARTPRDGRHVYLRLPDGVVIKNSQSVLAAGVDVRGEGGYVLTPPSTGYSWANDAPIAEAPAWLLEMLRKPEKAATKKVKGEGRAVSVEAAGPKIPDGERNGTLASIAGRLHDGTRDLNALIADLTAINEARCCPPLPEAEVVKIACSIYSRTPCKTSSPEVAAEVMEALDDIEAVYLHDPERWKGNAWKSPYSALVVLLKLARKHGKLTDEGVQVSVGLRRLALDTGVRPLTIRRSIERLDAAGIAARFDNARSGSQSGAFVLRFAPRAHLTHSPTGGLPPSTVSSVRAPFTAERLRWSKPVMDKGERVDTVRRLGKTAERIVDILETRTGWTDVRDLADELGVKRLRDFRRRALARLEESGVIEASGDAVKLRLDWLDALNRRREDDEELKDCERDRKKYAEESRLHRLRLDALKLWKVESNPEEIALMLNASAVEVRHVLRLPAAPVRNEDPPRKDPDGLIEELHRVETPEIVSTEETGAAVSDSPALEDSPEGSTPGQNAEGPETAEQDRHAVIARAVEDLFRDYPEQRERRVGQITCRLIGKSYVPLDFCPKDAEVEAVLAGLEVAA